MCNRATYKNRFFGTRNKQLLKVHTKIIKEYYQRILKLLNPRPYLFFLLHHVFSQCELLEAA